MKVGVCGIACEICPRMAQGKCPAGARGCVPRNHDICPVCRCAHARGIRYCFECSEFPCETTKEGPIAYELCLYIAGKTA